MALAAHTGDAAFGVLVLHGSPRKAPESGVHPHCRPVKGRDSEQTCILQRGLGFRSCPVQGRRSLPEPLPIFREVPRAVGKYSRRGEGHCLGVLLRGGGSWEKWAWAGLASGPRPPSTVVSLPSLPEPGVDDTDRLVPTGSELYLVFFVDPVCLLFAPDESVLLLLSFFSLK